MKLHRYEHLKELIEKAISTGSIRAGERLPSVRQMAERSGYSVATVQRAYEILEAEGVCYAKPRSGYFYSGRAWRPHSDWPVELDDAAQEPKFIRTESEKLLVKWHQSSPKILETFLPNRDLFLTEPLDKLFRRAIRQGHRDNETVGMSSSEPALLVELAKRAAQRNIFVRPSEIIVTRSGTAALNLCISVFARPGDIILVESPSYFHSLASLRRRELQAIELYSHPTEGLDPDQFEYLLAKHDVKVCILCVTNRYPTGVSYSRDVVRSLVRSAQKHNAIIIENDTFGELSYKGDSITLKEFDDTGNVITFSSFTNTISPQYGLGYVISGRFTEELLAVQYSTGMQGSDRWMQKAIAGYLSSFSHDRQLRRIRTALEQRMSRGLDTLKANLSKDCVLSEPSGGYMCWLRAPKSYDAARVIDGDAKFAAGMCLPGGLFSITEAYANYVAFNFSAAWTEANLAALGTIASGISASP